MPSALTLVRRALLAPLLVGALAACNLMPGGASMDRAVAVPGSSTNILGDWLIEGLEGRPMVDYSVARLSFGADGRLTGSSGCNNLIGKFSVEGSRLAIGELGSTRKMCPAPQMEQERRVLDALAAADSAALVGGMLELSGGGKVLLRATPASVARAASAP